MYKGDSPRSTEEIVAINPESLDLRLQSLKVALEMELNLVGQGGFE